MLHILVLVLKASVLQRKKKNVLWTWGELSKWVWIKLQVSFVSSLLFTVEHEVCCLAKQQCSATVRWTVLTKYILLGEPLTEKFTQRNTRAIDCSYKALRSAAWEPVTIGDFLLKHRKGPGCSLPATSHGTSHLVLCLDRRSGRCSRITGDHGQQMCCF